MRPYAWNKLNTRQVGKFAEYFVKMEFTLHGFDVFTPEVDDKGVDCVVRRRSGHYYDVQVKSVRGYNYVFMQKQHFEPGPSLLVALVLLLDAAEPELFLIPSLRWKQPDKLFADRDYHGKKSKPEWGISLSAANRPLLEPFRFDVAVEGL
jgi:hypothetical protein